MAITPVGSAPAILRPTPKRAQQQTTASDSGLAGQIRSAERDANTRIMTAAQQAREAEAQAQTLLQHQRLELDRQAETESARQEAQIEEIRAKGYEQIREMQRAQQAAIRAVRQEGEANLAEISDHYRRTLHDTTQRRSTELQETQDQAVHRLDYERRQGEAQALDMAANRDAQLRTLREHSQDQIEQLQKSQRQEYDKTKANYAEATEKDIQQLQSKFENTLQTDADMLDRLNLRAGQQLDQIRQDTALKLATYAKRQEDPFYRMLELNSEFKDEGDTYSLTLRVPEYEKHHISASIRGDTLIVAGFRTNKEEITTEPGHTLGTSSYQTYHESFPLDWPVNAKELSRKILPDGIQFRVPKKGPSAKQPPTPKPPVEIARQARPNFPKNLTEPEYVSTDKAILQRAPGSDTLG